MSFYFGESTRENCRRAATKMYLAWCILDVSTQCVIGFDDGEKVYLHVCNHADIAPFIGPSRESKNETYFRTRFRIGKKAIPEMIKKSAVVCSLSELLEVKKEFGFSTMGEAFEIVVKRLFNLPAVKDSSKWWEGSDLTLPDGRTYSIKYNEATICQESHFIEMGFTTENDFPTDD